MHVHILGRQPALSLAELEARYGAQSVRPLATRGIALVETNDTSSLGCLGGSMKVGKVLTNIPGMSWSQLVGYLQKNIPRHVHYLPEGKLKFGLSVYGIDAQPGRINAGGLEIKKAIKNAGRSVRVIPNKDMALSSAQTLHNQLTGELGMELMLIKDGGKIILAQVLHVQDIDAYSLRDRNRPMRDARVGMLPPKLAQIIINLAVGNEPSEKDFVILDPFCGTGVILQEALLMRRHVYGSDLDERMVRYSRDNINWLQELTKTIYSRAWHLERGDATTHAWRQPIDAVAAETYLGTPLLKLPAPVDLDKIIKDCDKLHRAFLKNLAPQLKTGTRLCLAVPAWRVRNNFRHLPVIDDLADLGYNQVDFKHAQAIDLIYHREGQLVARELLVLTRK